MTGAPPPMNPPALDRSPVAPYCSNCFGTDTVCERHASRVGEPDTAAVEPPGDLLAAIRDCAGDWRTRQQLQPPVVHAPAEAAGSEAVQRLREAGVEVRLVPRDAIELDTAAVAALAAGEYPAYRDDPTPTTGPPSDYYYFPDGCRCHIRDDIDYGEHYSPPPDGCPAHTPWAFSGYSLAQEGRNPPPAGRTL